jgi:hypothetical protein
LNPLKRLRLAQVPANLKSPHVFKKLFRPDRARV